MSLDIKIKYFHDELVHPEKKDIGDWIDLRAAETVELKAGEYREIRLGIAMELPEGYEAWLTSRSSTRKKFGIVHCDDLGVIDRRFCGDNDEWVIPVIAVEDTTIHFNDRICQFRIAEQMPQVNLIEVKQLGNLDRGGHGSTGRQ